MHSMKYPWVKTEERGKYGAIYHNRMTGELAEERDGYLVSLPAAVPVTAHSCGGSHYLLEQARV